MHVALSFCVCLPTDTYVLLCLIPYILTRPPLPPCAPLPAQSEAYGHLNISVEDAAALGLTELSKGQLRLFAALAATKPISMAEVSLLLRGRSPVWRSDAVHFFSSAPPHLRTNIVGYHGLPIASKVELYCGRPRPAAPAVQLLQGLPVYGPAPPPPALLLECAACTFTFYCRNYVAIRPPKRKPGDAPDDERRYSRPRAPCWWAPTRGTTWS